MASGKTLEKLRQLYAKVDVDVKRWAAMQARAASMPPPCCCCRRRQSALLPPGGTSLLLSLPAHTSVLASQPADISVAPSVETHHAAFCPPLLQEQALSLLGTIANVAARLPALEDPAAYGTLLAAAIAPGLQQRLLAKQLAALDELIMQLQGCLRDMQVGAAAGSAAGRGRAAGDKGLGSE